jgi:hypothetical protein
MWLIAMIYSKKKFFFIGNTPLHLAMESAHGEAAVLLIDAGADRGRVRDLFQFISKKVACFAEIR